MVVKAHRLSWKSQSVSETMSHLLMFQHFSFYDTELYKCRNLLNEIHAIVIHWLKEADMLFSFIHAMGHIILGSSVNELQ